MNTLNYTFWHRFSRMTAISSYSAFRFLLEKLKPDLVCDVGSRDAADSLNIKSFLPQAEIHAFEANPVLVDKIKSDTRVQAAGVIVNWNAVSNRTGKATFKLFSLESGNGSLRNATSEITGEGSQSYEVDCVCLGNYLSDRGKNIALWIDVEGCGYEVLEGLGDAARRVCAIHIEVETKPFWEGQKLIGDTEKLMRQMGFIPVATSLTLEANQGNITFIREEVLKNTPGLYKDLIRLSIGNLAAKWKLETELPKLYKLGKLIFPRKSFR